MMQNNPMGAPAPANPQTPGLNFQSDPGMRSQFKGFMSGLQARQAPAPMMQPPMAMPTVPQQMATTDIFQPVQAFAGGGSVPRETSMGGLPHMLSYITPGEAAVLQAMGGTGQPGPGGVPSFVYDEAGMGMSRGSFTKGPSMGDRSFDYTSAGFSDPSLGDDDNTLSMGQTLGAPSMVADLFSMGNDNRTQPGQVLVDALTAKDANIPEIDALQDQINRKQQNEAALAQANRNAAMQQASQGIQSVIQGNRQSDADALAILDTSMDNELLNGALDTGPEAQDAYEQRLIAEYITNRGGNVSVDPMTGQVSGNIDQVFDIDTTFAPYEIDGISARPIPTPAPRPGTLIDYADPTQVPRNLPSAPPSRPNAISEAAAIRNAVDDTGGYDTAGLNVPTPPQVGDLAAMGGGAFPAAPQMESVLDRAARKDDMSGARQLVQRGFGAGMTPMEQLEARTGREYAPLGTSDIPSVGAALQGALNAAGRGTSQKLLDRINAGGTPQYDNTGQIVGVYTPDSGLFGATTYFGRPEYRDPAREREVARQSGASTLPESVLKITDPNYDFGDDDDAANSFLRRLVQGNLFEKGGETPTPFRAGGGVGRQDYQGGTMPGVTGNVSGSTTSDAASSRATEGVNSGTGRSFSGADLYSNQNMAQDNVQSVMAAPASQPQNTVNGGQLGSQSPDVVPATVSEGEFLNPLQPTAQQPQNIRERIASVADTSTPTMGNLLSDLFNFSSDPNAMSDLERTQLEVRAAKAARGEDYYGQNLTPSLEQAYSQAGIAAAPAPAGALQRGVSGGQRVSVPVAAQYLSPQQVAAGKQAGVQMRGELLGLGGRYN